MGMGLKRVHIASFVRPETYSRKHTHGNLPFGVVGQEKKVGVALESHLLIPPN